MPIRYIVIYVLAFLVAFPAHFLFPPQSVLEAALLGGGIGLIAASVTFVYDRFHSHRKQ